MKVVFLDIDGVFSSWKNPNFRREGSKIFGVSETDCLRLNKLSEKYGFETILSSTYRLVDSETEYLKSKGLKIYGKTENFNGKYDGDPRPYEIKSFVDSNSVKKYAILDDSIVEPMDDKGFFIRTSMEEGMTESHWERLSLFFLGKVIGDSVFEVEMLAKDACEEHPNSVFVFGDNSIRKGTAGQASIRFCKNALGIATKKFPSMNPSAFFNDSEEDFAMVKSDIEKLYALKLEGKNIVFPKSGIGTGLAKMKEKSPKLWKFMTEELEKKFKYSNGS